MPLSAHLKHGAKVNRMSKLGRIRDAVSEEAPHDNGIADCAYWITEQHLAAHWPNQEAQISWVPKESAIPEKILDKSWENCMREAKSEIERWLPSSTQTWNKYIQLMLPGISQEENKKQLTWWPIAQFWILFLWHTRWRKAVQTTVQLECNNPPFKLWGNYPREFVV